MKKIEIHMMKHALPETLLDTFRVGMDRPLPEFYPAPSSGRRLNLGAGRKFLAGTEVFDAPEWRAPILAGVPDRSCGAVYAFHFLEHLDKEDLLDMLREVERVLQVGGIFNIVVPHWSSELAHQDLDHKTFFTEQTFKNLMDNPYYDGTMPREWKFRIQSSVIMGLVQRNLSLFVQLVRTAG